MALALKVSMPWSFFDHTSRLFAAHVIVNGESERPSRPESGAHWQYQVDRELRGQGIGTELLRRFTRDAIEADFHLIWAEVMAYPEKPPAYFEERGWAIYDTKPTTIFGEHVDFPIQILCITKPLSP